MVGTISNIHIAFSIGSYVVRIVELSIVGAMATKTTEVREVRVQNLNPVVTMFSNIHLASARMNCNACWITELKRSTALCTDCSEVFACGMTTDEYDDCYSLPQECFLQCLLLHLRGLLELTRT